MKITEEEWSGGVPSERMDYGGHSLSNGLVIKLTWPMPISFFQLLHLELLFLSR